MPSLLSPRTTVSESNGSAAVVGGHHVKRARVGSCCHKGRPHAACLTVLWCGCRYYATDAELRRLFKSVNGLIFPGGLTDLYIDDPYVIAAKKLHTWAAEANDAGEVHTALYGHDGNPESKKVGNAHVKLHVRHPTPS